MLSSRRLLASVGMYDGSAPGLGLPDGIKVDTKGRIYIGSPDGVQGRQLFILNCEHFICLVPCADCMPV